MGGWEGRGSAQPRLNRCWHVHAEKSWHLPYLPGKLACSPSGQPLVLLGGQHVLPSLAGGSGGMGAQGALLPAGRLPVTCQHPLACAGSFAAGTGGCRLTNAPQLLGAASPAPGPSAWCPCLGGGGTPVTVPLGLRVSGGCSASAKPQLCSRDATCSGEL